jgi:hypothetical protein
MVLLLQFVTNALQFVTIAFAVFNKYCFFSLLLLLSAICYYCFLQYVIIAFCFVLRCCHLNSTALCGGAGFYLEFQT